jgi:ATP-dependent Clp protease ATP-binding subunit ClpC
MFERFTERARQVVVLAQDEARTLKHGYIGTEHLLLGILALEDGIACEVLDDFGVRLHDVRPQVAHMIGRGDAVRAGEIPFTPRAKHVLELSLREAASLRHSTIGAEHILLGLIRENGGVAARILADLGVDSRSLAERVLRELGSEPSSAGAYGLEASAPTGRYRIGTGLIVAGALLVALAVGVGVLIGWLIWR